MLHAALSNPVPGAFAPMAGHYMFGFAVTPAVAHQVGLCRSVTLRLLTAAGETHRALALMPQLVGPNTLRLHVERAVLEEVQRLNGNDQDAVLTCRIGDEASLRLTGPLHREHRGTGDHGADFVAMRLIVRSWDIAGATAHNRPHP